MRHVFFSLVVAFAVMIPRISTALTVEGKTFAPTVTIADKPLKLIGAGLREKWFFDVYVMAAYSESGTCDPKTIIGKDEVKFLKLVMLRDVSAEKMASSISDAFGEHMPKNASAELRQQRKAFQGYFKEECKENTVLEFIYRPDKGTILKQNGKYLGPPFTGSEFARVLWDIYFAKESCCDDLRDEILERCKKRP